VCPYRAVDDHLTKAVARRLFSLGSHDFELVPAPRLSDAVLRQRLHDQVLAGKPVIVFLQDKLGGEISVSRTDRSPEFSFDITMVELVKHRDGVSIGRFGILEVQTMDFHGSYRLAVNNLRDALRLHGTDFAEVLTANPQWLAEKIEGPNIANVFKRTFYQLMLKFRVGEQPPCVGAALALPQAVWDSWQRHLGAPSLSADPAGFDTLHAPGRTLPDHPPAWIFVFDLSTARSSPSDILIVAEIATDAESVAHFALDVAPRAAVQPGGNMWAVPSSIRGRISTWWPDLVVPD
jgi:hypothetical protein